MRYSYSRSSSPADPPPQSALYATPNNWLIILAEHRAVFYDCIFTTYCFFLNLSGINPVEQRRRHEASTGLGDRQADELRGVLVSYTKPCLRRYQLLCHLLYCESVIPVLTKASSTATPALPTPSVVSLTFSKARTVQCEYSIRTSGTRSSC